MAFENAVPSLPYELLAKEEYNHAAYKQSEYRDILALVECSSRWGHTLNTSLTTTRIGTI